MQAVLGVIFHFIGGGASASFPVPFKRVKGWSWESYWIVGGFFSWLIVPFLAAALTVPNFWQIIQGAAPATVFWTYFMGVLWGIGGLTFGLGLRYMGISLGQTIMLGLSSAFGSLMPPIYRDLVNSPTGETFSHMISNPSGQVVLLGILVCLGGIVICGKAGLLKEKDLSPEQKTQSVKEFNISKGLSVAIVSGILSACFNYAIEAGKPMAEVAVQTGNNPLFQNNVSYIVILLGGLTTNFLWCMILNAKNRTFIDYHNGEKPLANNYFFSALAGTTWYLQFFFYGMGESKLGNGPSSWILHMAFIILLSNLWGLILGEWKGVSRKTFTTILAGIATIIISIL